MNPKETEILTILSQHADGLGTKQLFNKTKDNASSEFETVEQVSKLLYKLCNEGRLYTPDVEGGKIYKIMPAGLAALQPRAEPETAAVPAPEHATAEDYTEDYDLNTWEPV